MELRKPYLSLQRNVVLLVLSLNLVAAAGNFGNLEGKRAMCSREGFKVPVDHIDKLKCFKCICKNGYVECRSGLQCPSTEGCHFLVQKPDNACSSCHVCKGCTYKGLYHHSSTEWTDPDDPCKVVKCVAGVITVSSMICHVPCSNPLPPEPGKCCSRCTECKINGQQTTDNFDVISDDPCLKCRCNEGKMVCSKSACPVLQCPPKWQYRPPGECCPKCNGTRALMVAPKTCTIQTSVYREDHKFNIDKCTSCTCKNETSICVRNACPILDCGEDLQTKTPGSCCPTCSAPQEIRSQCYFNGKSYEDGQTWKLDACSSCECKAGKPSCAKMTCAAPLDCKPGSRIVHLDGECCPKCQEDDGVCMVFGHTHYKTFDGRIYTFQGIGRYQLMNDCVHKNFSIRIANLPNNNKYVKALPIKRRVAIKFGNLRINLQHKTRVKLNGKVIKLPFKFENKIDIQEFEGMVKVSLKNGVTLNWNGKTFFEIIVPSSFKNNLCGLCGNFNSNVEDDLKKKKGEIVNDDQVVNFGNSWCAGSKINCTKQSQYTPRITKCLHQRLDQNPCKQKLTQENLFIECNAKLNYKQYYRTCKSDMCNCPNGQCYCDSLLAYARECVRLGVYFRNWQSYTLCPFAQPKKRKKSNLVDDFIQKHQMVLH